MKHKPRRMLRRVAMSAGVLVLVLALPATVWAGPPSPLTPGTEGARTISDLFFIVLWLAIGVFVIVEGLLIFAIIRYRRRSDDEMPEQIHGNSTLEITWTVLPGILVVGLAVLTFRALQVGRSVPPDVMTVEVTGHQWQWEFYYPDSDVTVWNEFKLPVGQPVLLEISSSDVQHSFWMPELGGKVDAIPGHVNIMWFEVDEPGVYIGQCAEFCGLEHYNMLATVEVLEPAAYEAWQEEEIVKKGQFQAIGTDTESQLPPGDVAAGEDKYIELGCQACHSFVEGEEVVGPSQFNIGETAATRIEGTTAEQYLRESILLPCDFLVEGFTCVMPQDFGERLEAQDLADLIAYMLEQ